MKMSARSFSDKRLQQCSVTTNAVFSNIPFMQTSYNYDALMVTAERKPISDGERSLQKDEHRRICQKGGTSTCNKEKGLFDKKKAKKQGYDSFSQKGEARREAGREALLVARRKVSLLRRKQRSRILAFSRREARREVVTIVSNKDC
jgi:hypothetical protein